MSEGVRLLVLRGGPRDGETFPVGRGEEPGNLLLFRQQTFMAGEKARYVVTEERDERGAQIADWVEGT